MFGRLQHFADIPGTAAVDTDGNRPERAADHGSNATRNSMFAELGTIEMDMHIDAPRRGDQAFGIAHRGRSATQQILIDTIHGDQHVERAGGAVEAGNQADSVAQCLAATMQAFVAGNGVVMLDFG